MRLGLEKVRTQAAPAATASTTVADLPGRYLESVEHLLDDRAILPNGSAGPSSGKTAPRLQKYLVLKSWWATFREFYLLEAYPHPACVLAAHPTLC